MAADSLLENIGFEPLLVCRKKYIYVVLVFSLSFLEHWLGVLCPPQWWDITHQSDDPRNVHALLVPVSMLTCTLCGW